MSRSSPSVRRHGPLTVYVQPLEALPDLPRVVQALAPDDTFVWLDSARQHPLTGRWSMLGVHPWLTAIARDDRWMLRTSAGTRMETRHPLSGLRRVLRRYRAPRSAEPYARALGLMGWLSYDLNRWIERLPPPQPEGAEVPEVGVFAMRLVCLVDHLTGRGWLLSIVDPHQTPGVAHRDARDTLERYAALIASRGRPMERAPGTPACTVGAVTSTIRRAEFEALVHRVLEEIRAGEIFQANLSQRFTASWAGDVRTLYLALRRINPSPFACLLSCEELAVASCSPERLVRVEGDRVETRPIAGTRPRGRTADEDAVNSLELLMSEKERAEHIMLVDLERNDIGRVCRTGSVAVDELMALEAYSHVIHIVSNVAGVLRDGLDAVDVIRAVFPGGTITGCPKVRCMELLRQLEPVARGLYTGSLGRLGFDGAMDLNIAIRTLILRRGRLSFHVGAGIVADSDPAREYHETLAKGQALMQALRRVAPAIRASDSFGGAGCRPPSGDLRGAPGLPGGLHTTPADHATTR